MRILHLVSTFPAITHTFVFRTIRFFRQQGDDVIIGQLRPLYRTPAAEGFEDLRPCLDQGRWVSLETLRSILFFCFCAPSRLVECFRILSYFAERPCYLGKALGILLSSMRLAYRLRRASVDAVQADFLHSEALAARFCKSLMGVPYVLRVYTTFYHYPRKLVVEITREADAVVADTCEVRRFLEDLDVGPQKMHLIRNGISLEDFPYRLRLERPEPPVILAAGTLFPKKGFHVLLAACSRLRKGGSSFRCVIVGDGYERRALSELMVKLDLGSCVEILGYLGPAELRNWYYRADVFVMPSVVSPNGEVDGLPTVLIEAMATGLPAVGTRLGGIPELLRDHCNGFIVPPNDPEELAERMGRLLQDPALRRRFGREGRRTIEDEFDLSRNLAGLREVLCGVTAPSGLKASCRSVAMAASETAR